MPAARPSPKSRLSRNIAYRVARLHSETVKLLSQVCEAHGFGFNEWKVFSAVGSFGPISATEICRHTTIDKAMVSRVMRQLAGRKLIERRLAAQDARLVEVQLTPAGRAAYANTAAAIDGLQKRLLAGVSNEKVGEFLALLQLLEQRTNQVRTVRRNSEGAGAPPRGARQGVRRGGGAKRA